MNHGHGQFWERQPADADENGGKSQVKLRMITRS